MSKTEDGPLKERMPMPDIARFFGIVLVYYGHIIERIMYLKDPTATVQYKFIYSFHMPFFFVLAGFVAAPEKTRLKFKEFFKRQAASRLVPYVAFSALLVVLSLFFAGHFVAVDLSSAKGYLEGVVATGIGFPAFNIPLWFLACLFSVELFHFLLGRYLDTTWRLIGAAVGLYVVGYYLTLKVQFLPGPNFWFLHEALVVYPFYLAGVLMRRKGFLLGKNPSGLLITGVAMCGLAVLLTYDMNTGPFRMFDAVVIVLSGHGHILLFVFTALAGTLMLMALAKLCGTHRFFMFMGKNALILFCLNGVFYHFFNGPFADWFMKTFSADKVSVTLAGMVFTSVSLMCCVPFVLVFNKYVPQLVGKPAQDGPILKPLIRK